MIGCEQMKGSQLESKWHRCYRQHLQAKVPVMLWRPPPLSFAGSLPSLMSHRRRHIGQPGASPAQRPVYAL